MTHDSQPNQPAPRTLPPEDPAKARRRKTLNDLFVAVLIVGLVTWWTYINHMKASDAAVGIGIAAVVAFAYLVLRILHRLSDHPTTVTAGARPIAPAPGWYVDGSGVTRWFDGTRWTDITQPPPPPNSGTP